MQKMFIMMTFINDREQMLYFANFMKKIKQDEVANILLDFCEEQQFLPYLSLKQLDVKPTDVLRSGNSYQFIMDESPRGFCLIILNEPRLELQAKQMANIFTQMFFRAEIRLQQSSEQIKEIYLNLVKTVEFEDYNALVTISLGFFSSLRKP